MFLRMVGEYGPWFQATLGSMGFLGQDTLEPQPDTGETKQVHEYVCCHLDIIEIMLEAA